MYFMLGLLIEMLELALKVWLSQRCLGLGALDRMISSRADGLT